MARTLLLLTFAMVGLLASPVLGQSGQPVPSAQAEVRARTHTGILSGLRDGDLAIYRGIPFAQPPVGDLRWREPVAPQAWQGVRPAHQFARACMQAPNATVKVPTPPMSEDCLYLNVWSPARTAGDRLPVIVWIHGGGFTVGSTDMPLFDGAALARKGVVFVSITYRLGSFGFLAHPALSAESPHRVSGNYGLLDQIAALRWVKRNIAGFGGSPKRVTIMGESAGAMSVSLLAQSPLARGLFSGVIAQSGGSFGPPGHPVDTLPTAEAMGAVFGKAVGAETSAELRAIPAETLLAATQPGKFSFSSANSWPNADGYVVPRDPIEAYRSGKFNDTPVLMGANENEGGLFPQARTVEAYKAGLDREYGAAAARVLAEYPAADDEQAAASAMALMGDATFVVQHYIWARMQARYGRGRVFYYHFKHAPPLRPGVYPGPIHAAELAYVFHTLRARFSTWTPADGATADMLSSYWTNFAKYGDPNGPGLPGWPPYTAAKPQVVYFRDGKAEPGPIPHLKRMQLLDAVLDEQRTVAAKPGAKR